MNIEATSAPAQQTPTWQKGWQSLAKLTLGPLSVAEIYQHNGGWYASALVRGENFSVGESSKTPSVCSISLGGPWGMRESAERAAEAWFEQEKPPYGAL